MGRTIPLPGLARVALLALALMSAIGCAAFTTRESREPDIRGSIASITPASGEASLLGSLLVEGSEAGDTAYDRGSVSLTTKTRVYERGGRPLAFASLEPGMTVEVWFNGPVRDSYPVQATAAEIAVLSSD